MVLNCENLKTFSLSSGTRPRFPLLPFLFNIVIEVLAIVTRQQQNKQRHPSQRERSKITYVFKLYDLIQYIGNHKNTTKKSVKPNKLIQLSYRIQSQHTKISCFLLH